MSSVIQVLFLISSNFNIRPTFGNKQVGIVLLTKLFYVNKKGI